MNKKYYDGFDVIDILFKNLEPRKAWKVLEAFAEYDGVDAVEVVRCKDCKYAEHEDDGDIMCTFWDFCECNHHVLGNGYCDRAERKENDTDRVDTMQ